MLQGYAPTAGYDDEAVDSFYGDAESAKGTTQFTIVMRVPKGGTLKGANKFACIGRLRCRESKCTLSATRSCLIGQKTPEKGKRVPTLSGITVWDVTIFAHGESSLEKYL